MYFYDSENFVKLIAELKKEYQVVVKLHYAIMLLDKWGGASFL